LKLIYAVRYLEAWLAVALHRRAQGPKKKLPKFLLAHSVIAREKPLLYRFDFGSAWARLIFPCVVGPNASHHHDGPRKAPC
jgi:hypothetical protein